jgi:hypothetical protein
MRTDDVSWGRTAGSGSRGGTGDIYGIMMFVDNYQTKTNKLIFKSEPFFQ